MLPAANRGTGQNVGFPDTCNTPVGTATVPIPYPNTASHGSSSGFANMVNISGMNALCQKSTISSTSGDEAGTASATKGTGAFSLGSVIVFIEGTPAITLSSLTSGNNMNNSVGAVVVPAVTNVFFTYQASPDDHRATALALADAMSASAEVLAESASSSNEVLVLGISRFTLDVVSRVAASCGSRASSPAGLVLDLSGCPGGDLDAALRLADAFVPRGTHLGTLVDDDGDRRALRARSEAFSTLPLVLVVDAKTASAAEVFAAALSALGRATIVGERTYGKGRASAVRPVGLGAELVAEARYVDPEGAEIDAVGVLPHILIDGRVDGGAARDSALAAAVDLLRAATPEPSCTSRGAPEAAREAPAG